MSRHHHGMNPTLGASLSYTVRLLSEGGSVAAGSVCGGVPSHHIREWKCSKASACPANTHTRKRLCATSTTSTRHTSRRSSRRRAFENAKVLVHQFNSGYELHKKVKIGEAFAAPGRATTIDPNSMHAYSLRSSHNREKKKYEQAIVDHANRALIEELLATLNATGSTCCLPRCRWPAGG